MPKTDLEVIGHCLTMALRNVTAINEAAAVAEDFAAQDENAAQSLVILIQPTCVQTIGFLQSALGTLGRISGAVGERKQ